MLRPVDTVLLALSRFRPWARERMVYRALVVLSAPERPVPRQSSDEVGHQHGVDELAPALVVPLAVALALEAEGFVQPERGLVPGKDVELELAHLRLARPRRPPARAASSPLPAGDGSRPP